MNPSFSLIKIWLLRENAAMEGHDVSKRSRLLVLLAGMPGSGKSVVARILAEKGYPVVVMGDVVREETSRLGLRPSPENLMRVARMLRERHGPAAVAKVTAEKIEAMGSPVVVVDGVRSLDEVEVFKKLGRVVIVAVHASPRTRFERLRKRGRPGDPATWNEFESRDREELKLGLGSVIALADFVIVNEGTPEELRKSVERLLAFIEGALDHGQNTSRG